MISFMTRLFGHRVRCGQCGKSFAPNLEDDPLEGGGVLRRFVCPHCGTYVNVARISARGVDLIEEIQASTDAERVKELQRELTKEVRRA